jgi:hypothetical protein
MSQTITIEENKVKSPDPPSRHHLPFGRLTVLSKVEGLTALRKAEGRRCPRSLLPPPSRGQVCGALHLNPCWWSGILQNLLISEMSDESDGGFGN